MFFISLTTNVENKSVIHTLVDKNVLYAYGFVLVTRKAHGPYSVNFNTFMYPQ